MSSTLFDYEWQFLLQMVTRINYSETYRETCNTILQQMRTLIPYQTGIIFKTSRKNGQAALNSPVSTEPLDDSSDHAFFMEGSYPHWNEFIMSPYSMVFRQSDIIPPAKWEKTRVYREVWQPKNIYWGLFISLVRKDTPLIVLGILRSEENENFSERDVYIMNTLKDPLERKYYSIIENDSGESSGRFSRERVAEAAAEYHLTKREMEVLSMTFRGVGNDEICRVLGITQSTLNKHLSNLYAKTNIHNRTQLFSLVSGRREGG
ncbi:MAG: helix-turn-helix transcriptional regulator [Oscillospiraceae bacterium]|jgi:DNA-binding CsgD family transcriptional regulator|nr:helix-turn-helix transcriptional regulator [Oscillospiraceae bacterium]